MQESSNPSFSEQKHQRPYKPAIWVDGNAPGTGIGKAGPWKYTQPPPPPETYFISILDDCNLHLSSSSKVEGSLWPLERVMTSAIIGLR